MADWGTVNYLHYVKLLLVSEPQRTLRDDQVAPLFREPGVKTGYRLPNRGWGYYLASLVHVNNETLNVWTHLLGCVLMVYQLYSYAVIHGVWADESRRVIHVFNLCAVTYTCLSALAHTFHSKSELIHFVSFQIDYAGIGLNTFGFSLIAFYISCDSYTVYSTLSPFFLPLNVLFSWLSCFCGSFAKLRYSQTNNAVRRALQIGSIMLHILVCCFGGLQRYHAQLYLRDDAAPSDTMAHHTLHLTVLATAAFFFASHCPEKLLPGKCDFVGQGHQIFHVLVILMSRLQLEAAEIDLKILKVDFEREFPSWSALVLSLLGVVVFDVLTILILQRYVKGRIEKDSVY